MLLWANGLLRMDWVTGRRPGWGVLFETVIGPGVYSLTDVKVTSNVIPQRQRGLACTGEMRTV